MKIFANPKPLNNMEQTHKILLLFLGLSFTWTLNAQNNMLVYISKGNVSCHGGADGTITTSVVNGTAPFTYNWTKQGDAGFSAATTADAIADLEAGIYNLEVIDDNGNTAYPTTSIDISEPSPIIITNTLSNVSCNMGSDGAINVNVSGGVLPYTFAWTGDLLSGTEDLTNIAAGTYNFVVTDGNNCSESLIGLLVSEPAELSATLTASTDATCNASATGTGTVAIAGGTSPYNFDWKNSSGNTVSNNQNLTTAIADFYTFNITDAKGCSDAIPNVEIAEPAVLQAIPTINDVNCYDAATGEINLEVTGGTTPYNFQWSKDGSNIVLPTAATLSNIQGGIYTVTITDSKNCELVLENLLVNQPTAELSVSAMITNAACYGENTGAIHLTIAGGTTPYSFQWFGAAFSTNQDIENKAAGNYGVIVTDVNGCQVTLSDLTISEPNAALDVQNIVQDVTCNALSNGGIDLTVTGGTMPYAYNWTTDNGTIIPTNTADLSTIQAGNYDLTVEDGNNCIVVIQDIAVVEPAILSLSKTITDVSCYEQAQGAVDLEVSGGMAPFNFEWQKIGASNFAFTGEDLNSVYAGDYFVTVTDANECESILEAVIEEPSAALVIDYETQNLFCFNDSTGFIHTTITGGTMPYASIWSGSNTSTNNQLDDMPAGAYVLQVTDVKGCQAQTPTIVLTQATELTASYIKNDIEGCKGDATGDISVSAQGGTTPYAYKWKNNQGIILNTVIEDLTDLTAGDYALSVTDANQCRVKFDTIAIEEPTELLTANIIIDTITCPQGSDGALTAVVNGGVTPYFYTWTGATTGSNDVIEDLEEGTYALEVKDANNCIIDISAFDLDDPSDFDINIIKENLACHNDSSGSISIEMMGGTAPYDYQWTGNLNDTLQNLIGLASGNYYVEVTDTLGCVYQHPNPITITEAAPLNITADVTALKCFESEDGEVLLTVFGGEEPYQFDWTAPVGNFNETQATALSSDTTMVTVTDAYGCMVDTVLFIPQPAALFLQKEVEQVSCYNNSDGLISLTMSYGTPPYEYNWNVDSLDGLDFAEGIEAGVYELTVTDANDCIWTEETTITEPEILEASFDLVHATCENMFDGSITSFPTGGTMPYEIEWISEDFFLPNSDSIVDIQPAQYVYELTDTNGCFFRETLTIEAVFEWCDGPEIYNTFTPDGDNVNDEWLIDGIELYPDNQLRVFNRLGQLVWEAEGYDNVENLWTGTDRFGKELAEGTYFFKLKVGATAFFPGKTYSSWVQLLR